MPAHPSYFQPQPGVAMNPTNRVRIPSHVLDIFTLHHPQASAAEHVVVLMCLGGELLVVPISAVPTLDPTIQTQVYAATVSARDQFRTITAADLTLATLDAVEQEVQAPGMNDAVYLYGTLQAQLGVTQGRLAVVELRERGRITVGRLALLHGTLLGVQHAFHAPNDASARISHMLLPAAPIADIRLGQGLVLVYPFLDPLKVNSVDTTFIIIRIVYDLLTRLQQDMRQEGVQNPFASAAIPVPSRRQLEDELRDVGYQIDGTTAFRQEGATGTSNNEPSLLGRLRRLAYEWTASRITLPPQATLDDYIELIRSLLASNVTAQDTAMLAALDGCVGPPIDSGPSPDAIGTPTIRCTPLPRSGVPVSRNWTEDFGEQPRSQAEPAGAWWRDSQEPLASPRDVVSQDDWLRDFLATSHVHAAESPLTKQQPAMDWSDDFAEHAHEPQLPPTTDWSDDFAHRT